MRIEFKKIVFTIFFCFSSFFYAHGQSDSLSSPTKDAYEKLALQTFHQLNSLIEVITNKERGFEIQRESIELAVKLFMSEDCKVIVANNSRVEKSYKIREYLTRLSLLNYENIKITYSYIYFIDNIYRNKDGSYIGRIAYQQMFTGYSNKEEPQYRDLTTKSVQVKIEPKILQSGNNGSVKKFVLLLGDIRVIEKH